MPSSSRTPRRPDLGPAVARMAKDIEREVFAPGYKVPAPPITDVYAGSPADQLAADMEKDAINRGEPGAGQEL